MKDNIPVSKIVGVQFSMLSPDEIRKASVVEVTSKETYMNGKPVAGGLFDVRMGVLEPGLICRTDGYTYIDTPGYFGHIELARPVFHIQHLKEIMKIMKCVCFKCSRLLLNKDLHKHVLNMSPDERWSYVYREASKIKNCGESSDDGCGHKHMTKIKQEGMANIWAIWEKMGEAGEDKKIKISPEIALKIFKRISDDDVSFMGFSPVWSRPEWMICEVLAVAPPAVRPSVKHDAQQRSEDDLTHIYHNIIKYNNDLRDKIANNVASNMIERVQEFLQYYIAMIVNNKAKGAEPLAQRSGRPFNCIMGRLNSKNGRIRGNLMGKRVDFSARSVITGDPNLSIRQLGVPMKIAKNITKPIKVNDKNRDFLMKLVQNGPDTYPGAKILEKKNGENTYLRYVDRLSIRLENGDTVHRHMMDGDAVLFNRQPSLHRMSMMCHIVKVMKKGDTFRMNVGCTKPYNADFDGDEMNMHMPQNVMAETELKHLAAIPYQIISPAGNSPIVGIFQDSLLGSYRMTRPNISFTPREAMNLLMMFPEVNIDELKSAIKNNKISSFDVLSQIMSKVTLKFKTKLFEDDEDPETSNNIFEVKNGKYIRGQIDKSVLGASSKGIIHRVFNDFGNMHASNFIDNIQNVVTEYMKSSSFSVGISDLIANKMTQDSIIEAITMQKKEVQSLIERVQLGTFENNTAKSNQVEFETEVNNILNEATNKAGKIGRKSLSKSNRFLMIVNSGSKGTLINISQMISCLGQTNIDGKRVPYGFEERTLPHYSKFDDSPGARGFIENSYISGLTAPELFFHAMGGRIGLIDTAVKTSQTGYIQRRLIKGLEDLKVEYDTTVRNNMGKIIQFEYGEDGFDSTKTENQFIPLVGMNLEDVYAHYDIIGINDEKTQTIHVYNPAATKRMRKQKTETKVKCKEYIEKMIDARDKVIGSVFKYKNENGVKLPVAFQHTITNIQGQFNLTANSIIDITPLEAFQMIEATFQKLNKIHYSKPNPLFEILFFFYLTPKSLLIQKRFHKEALTNLLQTIVLRYKEAIVHPGEMVGVIAGQSIGEPTTQLTLNTFHLSGVSSKSNVTRGVPRIEEILRLTKNPKNPSLTVYLKDIDEKDQDKANVYSKMLEHTKLVDLVKSVQICFDPNDEATNILGDRTLMEQYYEFQRLVEDCAGDDNVKTEHSRSKWIIRMELNAETMLDKNITTDDVYFAINNSEYGEEISCVYSDYNADNLVFRIRCNNSLLKSKKKGILDSLDQSDHIYFLQNFQDTLLNNIVLRGINRITNVLPRKLQSMVTKDEDKYVQNDVWVLDTTGTNLLGALSQDFIDKYRTVSNDIKEVYDVLGIEAAREVIHNELVEVMEFSGVYINYHHLSLLCDRMTCNKDMVSIFRSGILSDKIGPISKSTFEVHTEVLMSASRHAELDHMRGVSASVMMGQYGSFGTGSFQVVLDMNKLKEMDDEEVENTIDCDEVDKALEMDKSKDTCKKSAIEINNNIGAIKKEQGDICDDDNYDIGF